mmetsp:Transcript_49635/g.80093  ORF Transcript_49635/g.80093 Transcript_49635/m.80093 type:complete len:187 (-) Transcript_49635:444-1004(-)
MAAGVGVRSAHNHCGMLSNLFFSLVVIAVILPAAAQGAAEPSCDGRIRGQGEESSLVILKPDAVSRGHIGEAISRFEKAGLEIVEMRMTPKVSIETLKEHYKEHAARKFYQELIDSMSSGPIVIIHLRGSNAVTRVRKMLGVTDPSTAEPGSLRGTYGIDKTNNFMHASDAPDSAERELKLWLPRE